ncbi:MAG: hypothetical protein Q7T13_01580 [Polaromonas sp.]|nr:hypothetical protein [Polaromonas sp.]
MKTDSLVLNPYKPNLADPRVLNRIQTVLDWVKPMVVESRPRTISSAKLTEVFGNQKKDLSAYLRANLLIQSGTYQAGKSSYSYQLKQSGYEKLCGFIGKAVQTTPEVAQELYGDIAKGTYTPLYSEPTPGLRRFHPVQNLPKTLRADLFKGWYDYDIEAAAPSLVYQSAQRLLHDINGTRPEQVYPTIRKLIFEKAAVRTHVQTLTGCSPKIVKQILNGLFFSARLQASASTKIYALVDFNPETIEALKADPFIKSLMREVKAMWTLLIQAEKTRKGREFLFNGVESPNLKSSSTRMAIYLALERTVMDVMEEALKSDGTQYVLMHDGFMTSKASRKIFLEQKVKEKTGLEISLSEAVIGMDQEQEIEEEIFLE